MDFTLIVLSGVVAWDTSRRTSYVFRSFDCDAPDKRRTNTLNPGPADAYKVWQVAMATVAAATYFDSVKLDGHVFMDGGIATNNPTREAVFDVTALEGGDLHQGCVVSIGTGTSSKRNIPTRIPKIANRGLKALFDAADTILTGTETIHRDVQGLLYSSGVSYSRLTVAHVVDVRLDEWKRVPNVYRATEESLCESNMMNMLDNCATVLAQSIRDRQNPSKSQRFRRSRGQMGESKYHVNFSLKGIPFNDNFVERPAEMEKVDSALRSDEPRRRRICVITGLGGIGKTQLAAEYVRRRRDNHTSIFWVRAYDQSNILQDLKYSAERVYSEPQSTWGLEPRSQVSRNPKTQVNIFLAWLSKENNDRWLLVYDDVTDVKDILDFMPVADHGSILITTRSLDVTRLGTQVSLGTMSNEQSTQWLASAVADGDQIQGETFGKLLDELGGIPLAISRAAYHIRIMGLSISEYYAMFQDANMKMMNLGGRPEQSSYFDTFRISLEMIQEKNDRAIGLLQLWSFLDPEELWFGLLEPALLKQAVSPRTWVPAWFVDLEGDRSRFYELVEVLLGSSLISLGSQKTTYSIHRLLQGYIRDTLADDTCIVNIVLAALVVGSAVSQSAHPVSWPEQQRLLPHAIGYSHLFAGWDVDQSQYLNKVLNRVHDHEHDKNDEYYQGFEEAICNIGRFLIDHERLGEAATLLHRLMSKTRVLDNQHDPTNSTLYAQVGRLMLLQGRFEEAEDLLKSALIGRLDSRSANDNFILITKSNLARTYFEQKRIEGSRALIFDIMDTLPSMNLDHIDLTLILALTTTFAFDMRQGDNAELVESWNFKLRRFLHLKMYDTASDLTVCAALGRLCYLCYIYFNEPIYLVEAEKMCQQVLEDKKRTRGGPPLAGLTVGNNLACVLAMQGRIEKAESLWRSTLDRAQAMLGDFHPAIKLMTRNLASMKQQSGETDEAQALIEGGRDKTTETIEDPALRNMILLPIVEDPAAVEGEKRLSQFKR